MGSNRKRLTMAVSALDDKRPDASRNSSTLDGAWDQADVAAMSATIADEYPMTRITLASDNPMRLCCNQRKTPDSKSQTPDARYGWIGLANSSQDSWARAWPRWATYLSEIPVYRLRRELAKKIRPFSRRLHKKGSNHDALE